MSVFRVSLELLSPLYRGTEGRARKSGAFVHSDTLHAALMDVAASTASPLMPELPQLAVSSVLPFWKDLYFYPRPFWPLAGHSEEGDPTGRKRWKNVRLVSERVLRAWLAEDASLAGKTEVLPGGIAVLQNELKGKALPLEGLFREDLAPAVTVDRANAGATPYERRSLRVNAAGGVGLYFLTDLAESQVPAFRELVRRLGELGIGGERSIGYGHFSVLNLEPAGQTALLEAKKQRERFLTLSLYLPSRAEVDSGVLAAPAAYDCTIRGGWIHDGTGTDQRKRSVRMCIEGSVFPCVTAPPLGEVRDLRPNSFTTHPVWRSGRAFPVFF